jgi:hypothetical protein
MLEENRPATAILPILLENSPSSQPVRYASKIPCTDRPARNSRPKAQQIDNNVDSEKRAAEKDHKRPARSDRDERG